MDWCAPHMVNDVIVSIDAPLIVPNLTGRRDCERVISRCYGGRHAGAHSSNRSMPAFANGGRAHALVQRLGLDVDPVLDVGASVRRAIEMYPHPAIVTLLSLDRALAYKSKSTRSVATRKRAFESLFAGLEGLSHTQPALRVETSPRWTGLRRDMASAAGNAALDRIEDEVDAYVCAYVGLFYLTHGLVRCRVVGDSSRGYIVTPVTESDGQRIDSLWAELQLEVGGRGALRSDVPSVR